MNRRQISAIAFVIMTAAAWIINSLSDSTLARATASDSAAGAYSYPKVCTYENVVAITFDDGPRRKTTERLLDGLKERGVKATFFLIGENIEGNEDIVRRIHDEGHLIGNHTFSHVQLTSLSDELAVKEVDMTNAAITAATGITPRFIRPPYGMISEKVEEEIDMQSIMWSVDPADWNTADCGAVVRHVVTNVKSGDIILMHDIYDSSVTAALEIIDELTAKGYVFVTADCLLID